MEQMPKKKPGESDLEFQVRFNRWKKEKLAKERLEKNEQVKARYNIRKKSVEKDD